MFHASCASRFRGAKLTADVCRLTYVTNKDSHVYIDSLCTGDVILSITDKYPHATLRRQSTGDAKEAGHEGHRGGGDVNTFLTTE